MIVLIEEDNRMEYDDHFTWIAKVYNIPIENGGEIYTTYQNFILKECKAVNISVSFGYNKYSTMPFLIGDSITKTSDLWGSENYTPKVSHPTKLHKILRDWNIYNWIEKTYNIKPLDFKIFKN